VLVVPPEAEGVYLRGRPVPRRGYDHFRP
jgi:hypothetical protein